MNKKLENTMYTVLALFVFGVIAFQIHVILQLREDWKTWAWNFNKVSVFNFHDKQE